MNSNIESGNHIMESFEFESGRVLENVCVEYGTSGTPKYDEDGNIINAVVYCPTLKGANSILAQHHNVIYDFNRDEYFFIKITSLGTPDSCSPSSTGLRHNFPPYTNKDRVNFKRQFLAEKFNIKKLLGIIGEGAGGFETYEWAADYPDEMEFIIVLNSTYKTWGYRYVMVKAAEAIIDSCDDFYSDGYSVSLSKLIVAIARLRFTGYLSQDVFEGLSNDEIDALMEDYVDESLFMDIHDFKSRNDCLLEYDVFDKLSNIKAKALIMGTDGYLFFDAKNDILPLKDIIKGSRIVALKDKQNFYDDADYSDMGLEIVSFLKQFKR